MWQLKVPLKKDIHAQTLIVWGTADESMDSKLPKFTAKYVKNSCTIHYIEGGSHWIQQEYPAEVNGYIRDFLTNTPEPKLHDSKL